jgi:hypothetical protein
MPGAPEPDDHLALVLPSVYRDVFCTRSISFLIVIYPRVTRANTALCLEFVIFVVRLE